MTFNKNQLVHIAGDEMRCIVADGELAVFARTSLRYDAEGKSFINTDYEKLSVFDNTGTVSVEFVPLQESELHAQC